MKKIVILVAFMMIGCVSNYQKCQTLAEFRCNGSVIEMCDGTNWNQRLDCGAMHINGTSEPQTCVEKEGGATCAN